MTSNISPITSTQPDVNISLKRLSIDVLFPVLIIAPTLLNQYSSELRLLGQIIMMGGTLAAIGILFFNMRRQKWLVLFVAGLLVSKAGRIAFGENSLFFTLYIIFMAFLFSGAGSVVLLERPKLIYRQVMMFCKLSVPLMVFQVLGVGKWTQFLRTDFHGYLDEQKIQFMTLFAHRVEITTLQTRPAGFCYANNVLTPWVIFALGLHYGLTKTSKLTFNDFVLCTIAILTMSKLVFLSFGVIMLWLMIAGDGRRRRRIIKVVFLFCGLLAAYSFFFPGLYSYALGSELLKMNFYGRVSVLAESLGDGTAKEIIMDAFGESPYYGVSESVSGYSVTAKGLKYVIVPALFAMLFYWWGFRRLRRDRPELVTVTILFIFIFFLMPLGNWFVEGPMFWFIAGFGLLPLFLLLKPYSVRPPLRYSVRRQR